MRRLPRGGWRRAAEWRRFRLSCLFAQTSESLYMRPTIDSLKLPMTTRFCLRTLAVLALALTMSACSLFGHKRDNIDTMPVDALYNNAHTSLENADYSAAIKAYQQYKDSQSDDAYSTVNRFIKTYPANRHVDYAYYLRGLINFDRTTGFMD